MGKITDGEFRVAVDGDFTSGKGRLINSIAGEEILPASFIPKLNRTFCIHFSRAVKEKIIRADGEEISYETFLEICSDNFENLRRENIDSIEIFVPAREGLDNLCLIGNKKNFSRVDLRILNSDSNSLILEDRADSGKAEARPFFISNEDAFEQIREELYSRRIKKFLPQAFKKLPEIIDSLNDVGANSFRQTLQALEKRYYDPEFRLAVIGNFSCGKSTFLNALTGHELLSTSVLPTTAIPTYIRWNKEAVLKSGRRDSRKYYNPIVKVTMSDGKSFVMTRTGRADFERECGIKLPDDTGELIDLLTTSDGLIGKIQKVELSFKERKGFENFCLIDTPGMNPGEEEKRAHITQAQNVLREEADAAIVLYAAISAMARDTREFLEQNAQHLMQGAIIVLTKMDLAPLKEYEKILKNTARLVKEQFHQNNPRVYDISAYRAINFISGRSKNADDEKWARKFNETISDIIGQLSWRRSAIVSGRIATLMMELAESISKIISEETGALTAESENLKKAAVENLEAEILALYEAYEHSLKSGSDRRLNDAKTIIRRHIFMKLNKIFCRIDEAENATELKSCLENYCPLILQDTDKEIIKAVNEEIISQINQYTAEYVKKVEECLKKYERYLGVVETKDLKIPEQLASNISHSPDILIEDSFVDNNAGLIASGVVGFLVAGPLALIGGYFIDKYRFNSKKDGVKDELSANLLDLDNQLVSAFTEYLSRIENENLAWAKDVLKQYKENYRGAFERIERKHQNRAKKVERRISRNTENLEFIRALKDGLT